MGKKKAREAAVAKAAEEEKAAKAQRVSKEKADELQRAKERREAEDRETKSRENKSAAPLDTRDGHDRRNARSDEVETRQSSGSNAKPQQQDAWTASSFHMVGGFSDWS